MRPRSAAAMLASATLLVTVGLAGCTGGGGSPGSAATASLPRLGGSPSASGASVIGPYSPGASSPTASAGSVPTARPSANPSVTRTPRPTGSAGGSPVTSAASVQAFHLAPELEPRLPTSAGGKPLVVESVRADGFRDANGVHPIGLRCRWYEGRGLRCRDAAELTAALSAIGRTPADVAIAVAYNETANQEVEVQATQVAGADAARFRDAVHKVLADEAAKGGGTLKSAESTVGGKPVIVITNASPYPLGLHRWLYASGDTLYDVRRAYDTEASEILAALP